MARHFMSDESASQITGVNLRTVRKWIADKTTTAKWAPIPWACWKLLQLYTGEITLDEYRLEVLRYAT